MLIVEIIVLLFIVWMFSLYNSIISKLENTLRAVVEHGGYNYPHPRIFSSYETGVDTRGNIHLVLYDANNKLFDNDTLILVGIHELAHLLSNDNGHGVDFTEVHRNLKESAIELGFLTDESKVSSMYPIGESRPKKTLQRK
jgi:hypothetical protein